MTDDPIFLPDPPPADTPTAERLPDPDPPAEPQPLPGPGFWGAVGWLLAVTAVSVAVAIPVVLVTGKPDGLPVLAAVTGGHCSPPCL